MHIFIHSDNRLFGECLSAGLNALSEVDAAEFIDNTGALSARVAAVHRPEILIDLATVGAAADLAQRLKLVSPLSCILALAVDDADPDNVIGCARMGFEAFVPRGALVDSVPGYIRKARRGEVVVPPETTASLFRALANPGSAASPQPVDAMTRREREVCMLICDGLTNKEIARELDRSVGTVKSHVHAILSKLDVPRRGAIASRVMQPAHLRLEGEREYCQKKLA